MSSIHKCFVFVVFSLFIILTPGERVSLDDGTQRVGEKNPMTKLNSFINAFQIEEKKREECAMSRDKFMPPISDPSKYL